MKTNKSQIADIIAPPPRIYLGAFALALTIQAFFPLSISIDPLILYLIGSLILIASSILARWSFVSMAKQGTSANPNKPSNVLMTHGPFRISRNPIYLAMTGLYIAATLLINSIWPLIFLLPVIATMRWGVILREEKYLSQIFGESYSAYKLTTRRWL